MSTDCSVRALAGWAASVVIGRRETLLADKWACTACRRSTRICPENRTLHSDLNFKPPDSLFLNYEYIRICQYAPNKGLATLLLVACPNRPQPQALRFAIVGAGYKSRASAPAKNEYLCISIVGL